MYISGHPLNDYLDEFKKLSFNMSMLSDDEFEDGGAAENGADAPNSPNATNAARQVRDGESVTAGGVLTGVSKKMTKNGKMMAYGKLEDLFGIIEVVFFPSQYEKFREKLANDSVVKVLGTIKLSRDESPKIIVNDMTVWSKNQNDGETASLFSPQNADPSDPSEPPLKKQKTLYIKIEEDLKRELAVLSDIFAEYPGDTAVKVQFNDQVFETGEYVNYSSSLKWELNTVVADASRIKYVEK
jgi:DNA polymerase III alpha subunit